MFRLYRRFALIGVAAAALAACENDSTSPTGSSATELQVHAGSGQTAALGATVATPPAVRAVNAQGQPVAGVNVTFTVTGGGGSVTGGTSTTNSSGVAAVTTWTLGTTPGSNTVQATATGAQPASFTATAVATTAASIELQSVNNQSATVGTQLLSPPSVRVRDAANNPVIGTLVHFAVTVGNGSVGGANAVTNAQGIATAGSWTLGITAGTNAVAVQVQGLQPLTIVATGTPAPAASLSINSGNNQSTTAGLAPPLAPSVIARDSYGNVVHGVTVTFAVTAGGGSVSGGQSITGTNGVAQVGSWTFGAATGPQTLTATAAGLPSLAINGTAISGIAAAITLTGGAGQSVTVGTSLPVMPQVRVTDANGAPIAGITVGFQVGSGGGTITGETATTSGNGVAQPLSWTLGTAAGSNSLSATVSGIPAVVVTATGTAGPATQFTKISGDNTSAVAGSTALPLGVLVRDAFNNPVSGAQITFMVMSGGGSIAGGTLTTNAAGTAQQANFSLGAMAGENSVSASTPGLPALLFTVTGVAGAPVSLSKIAGDNQNGVVGTQLGVHPEVFVADVNGNPVSNVEVAFSVISGGGAIAQHSVHTAANGRAIAGSWTLGTATGANQLYARTTLPGGLMLAATFNASAVPDAPFAMTIVSGNNQSGIIGGALPQFATVRVVDQYGNPVTGAAVTFSVATGGGSISGAVTGTNVVGMATSGEWRLGPLPGVNSMRAQTPGVAPRTFTAIANGILVAAGGIGAGGTIRTSLDGLSWTERSSPFTDLGRAVGYNGALWLAGAQGSVTLARSINAFDWVAVANPLTTFVNGIAWNGTMWVAAGTDGGNGVSIATSNDGVNWTARQSPFNKATSFATSVAWNGTRWVVGGTAFGGDTGLATSLDGVTWTAVASPFTIAVTNIAWNGTIFVATGQGGTSIATSSDGLVWTARASPFAHFAAAVAWNGQMWMATGGFNVANAIATSPDGVVWTARPSTFFEALSVTWTGSQWVVMGRTAALLPIAGVSVDGISWSTAPSGFSGLAAALGWSQLILPQ